MNGELQEGGGLEMCADCCSICGSGGQGAGRGQVDVLGGRHGTESGSEVCGGVVTVEPQRGARQKLSIRQRTR
eukprot:1677643-Rhodomonas_salina.1